MNRRTLLKALGAVALGVTGAPLWARRESLDPRREDFGYPLETAGLVCHYVAYADDGARLEFCEGTAEVTA